MLDEIKAKIEDEVERLLHELNKELPARIKAALELGDLRENADYKAALERQQFVQARLNHLTERMQELAKIDMKEIPTDRVGFGTRLSVRNLDTGDESTYTITSGDFIDLDNGHISMASPLGQAFMGRFEGDEVAVQLPAGERRFQILDILTLPKAVSDA